jgi:hypothetical protein
MNANHHGTKNMKRTFPVLVDFDREFYAVEKQMLSLRRRTYVLVLVLSASIVLNGYLLFCQ